MLKKSSSTREASCRCAFCNDTILKSEISFLKNGIDPAERSKKRAIVPPEAKDNAPAVNVRKADAAQSVQSPITEEELREALIEDRALLHTLDPTFLRNRYTSERKVGTKMGRLLQEIKDMVKKSPQSKCVVFTHHIGILDIASTQLLALGIGFVRIDGTKQQHERADALLEFSSNPCAKVFLLSMGCGAIGLTLTAADHCFIFDVSPNSAIEEQAIDRIHRIGQTRPVTVKRLIMEGTVEQRLLSVRRSLVGDHQPNCDRRSRAQHTVDGQEPKMFVERKKRQRAEDEAEDNMQRERRFTMLKELLVCPAATAAPAH